VQHSGKKFLFLNLFPECNTRRRNSFFRKPSSPSAHAQALTEAPWPFLKNVLPQVPNAQALGEAPCTFLKKFTLDPLFFFLFFFFSFALTCHKQNIYLYKPKIDFNISQATFINYKRHIQKCGQISPESTIYYIQTKYPKVHIIPSSQVQYIKTSMAGGSRQLGSQRCSSWGCLDVRPRRPPT
jgi:hypothetical protein